MKLLKFAFLTVLCSAFLACAVLVNGEGFSKSDSYKQGMFADVAGGQWYENSVKDAYEFGLMQGNSDTTFNPNGTLSVAEGITIASRIHSIINGTSIPDAEGAWYQKYVDYAVENSLIKADDFDSYDRNIYRFEMARLLSSAGKSTFELLNTIDEIPDVSSDNPDAESIYTLYRAGILTGNDDYGSFNGSGLLKRSEMSAMAVRIADREQRQKKALLKPAPRAFGDSYSLIDAPTTYANSASALKEAVPNGWNGDNRFLLAHKLSDSSRFLQMNDSDTSKFFALNRSFETENNGVLTTELYILAKGTDNGIFVSLQNDKEENVVCLTPQNGVWTLVGENKAATDVEISNSQTVWYSISLNVDLDKNTASVKINNSPAVSVFVRDDFICRLKIGTSKEGIGSVSLDYAKMWKNKAINEHFLVPDSCDGKNPVGWNVNGSFALSKIASSKGNEIYSMRSETKAGAVSSASTDFEALSGTFSVEAYVLFPEITDGAKISFTSQGADVLTFETKNGKLYYKDTVVNDYIANIWQCLCIDADTKTGKATVRVNGKQKLISDFSCDYIDGFSVTFSPSKDAVMWFDDVQAYPLVEHDDYPSYPKISESKDYNIGVNVCWLWRDFNCGEGWDSISSFPEFEPVLGYYDEGSREYADWEIKQLVEHGVDFLHVCWYSPNDNTDTPIKNEDYSFSAMHDGYFNAKYSDMIDFCVMWENASDEDQNGFENFKNRLWNYWVEYYFKDSRYLKLDNKAVFTIFKPENLIKTFGSAENVKKAVEFMNEDIKNYGYDGIIILSDDEWYNSYDFLNSLGFDGSYAYQWGRDGSDGDYQIEQNHLFDSLAADAGSYHMPTVSVGFNAVARGFSRSGFISTEDHLKVCQDIKKMLDEKNDGTWKSNTLMISTLNEYSEGHFVAPSGDIGYSLLDNIRKTFTDNTDEKHDADVLPTSAQKDRITHMYPKGHSPLRRLLLEEEKLLPENLRNVKVYDMSFEEDALAWKANHNVSDLKIEQSILSGKGTADDFGIVNSGVLDLDAGTADVIHIKMWNSDTGVVQLFFATTNSPSLSPDKCITLDVTKAQTYTDYYFSLFSNTAWNGNVTSVRIDPLNKASTFRISKISFMKNDASKGECFVNGTKLAFPFSVALSDDGDLETAIDADFLLATGFYYEWNRFDGILTLKNRSEDKIVYTVGKNTALVNGKEYSLGYTVSLRDGLPVVRIKQLFDLAGYEYEEKGNSIYLVTCSDSEYEVLLALENNCWEFGIDGELFGFRGQHCILSSEDGCLCLEGTDEDMAIFVTRTINSEDCNTIRIGVKYEEGMELKYPQIFFMTSGMPWFTAECSVDGEYNIPENVKNGDTVEAVFRMRENPMFKGIITSLRFDPFNPKQNLKIDYIRAQYDEEYAALMDAPEYRFVDDANQWDFSKGSATLDDWGFLNCEDHYIQGNYAVFVPNNEDTGIMRSVSIDASDYQMVVIGVKYTKEMKTTSPELYFMNYGDEGYSAYKFCKGEYKIPKDASLGDDIVAVFDLRNNFQWNGKISSLRFDPFSALTSYEVSSFRLCTADPLPPVEIPTPTRPTELVMDADGNISEGIKYEGVNATISVVEDPEDSSKKVFKVGAVGSDNFYTYMNIYMQFEPGETYEISYRIYPLKDFAGKSYKNTNIAATLLYGTLSNRDIVNHRVGEDVPMSEGDGWVTVNRRFVVDEDYWPTENDSFTFWGTPANGTEISYLISDIKVVKV